MLPAYDPKPKRDVGRTISEDVIKLIGTTRILFALAVISLVWNLLTLVGLMIWWLR